MTKSIHQDWLLELTALPTAAGREDLVVEWVKRWAARRRIGVKSDRFGNLVLTPRQSTAARPHQPIYFTAHMDHPAFVVTRAVDRRNIEAVFRGGVDDRYFVGSAVLLHHAGQPPQRGKVVSLENKQANGGGKQVVAAFKRDVMAEAGDVMTWDTGRQRFRGGRGFRGDRLFTPACDDLAGVAAALAALETLSRKRLGRGVRVLLTRGEEVGFLGAIGACKAGTMERGSRVIALENSKSFAESPIGAGPIVRVGDRTSTFDPGLTYLVGRIAAEIAAADPTFRWQRKLMPGGTCEASAYQAYGYTATCLCLPLGNYHNMNEATGKIDAETISLGDYHGLIRLLVAIGEKLDDPAKAAPLRTRLDDLFEAGRGVLEEQKNEPQMNANKRKSEK